MCFHSQSNQIALMFRLCQSQFITRWHSFRHVTLRWRHFRSTGSLQDGKQWSAGWRHRHAIAISNAVAERRRVARETDNSRIKTPVFPISYKNVGNPDWTCSWGMWWDQWKSKKTPPIIFECLNSCDYYWSFACVLLFFSGYFLNYYRIIINSWLQLVS